MKFKIFLQERKYINENKEYFFLLDGRVPLAPKLWSRIQKINKVPICYHTTNLNGLKTIQKIQGQKKQISAFTVGDTTVAGGVETDGGILIELSGESTLTLDGDAWTSLDRSGTRWWDLEEMANGQVHMKPLINLRERLQTAMKDVLKAAMKDVLKDNFGNFFTNKNFKYQPPSFLASIITNKFSGKDKAKFIKMGLDVAEKIIKSVDFDSIIKLANEEGNKIYGSMAHFDEIVLHNFKILNVYGVVGYHGINDKIKEVIDLQRSNKIKLDGWTSAKYIEDIDNTKVEFVENPYSL